MGKVSKETGVLKLVRAGGIVESYKYPILAYQIMERYPRHCVTRPDFFRNPYIVVKPESVLRPGKVFFIVPYHTVYRLFKSKGNERANKQTLENINHRIENVDTSFFHQIENVRNKKPSSFVFKDGDDDDDSDAASGCFVPRKKGGGLGENDASRSGGLKPCLKKNRPDKLARFQQGPRVRFMLPDEDDDEKWDTDFSEF